MTQTEYKQQIYELVQSFLEAPHSLSLSESLPFGWDYSEYTEEERNKRKLELKNRAEKNMYNSRIKYLIDELWRLKQQYELSNKEVMHTAVETVYEKDKIVLENGMGVEILRYTPHPILYINID